MGVDHWNMCPRVVVYSPSHDVFKSRTYDFSGADASVKYRRDQSKDNGEMTVVYIQND